MNRGLIDRIVHALTGRSFTVVQVNEESFLQIQSRQDLANYLGIDLRELTFFAFSRRSFYRHFSILKMDGTTRRSISAPIGKLRTLQKILAETLDVIYEAPYSVHGFVRDNSTVTNALPHVKAKGVLKLDIKDFFPSITSSRIHGLFASKPFCFPPEVVDTLTNLVCCNQELPQGAPTSPVLSNMICYRMDKTLLGFARNHMLKYTRYADDLTFSSTSRRAISSIVSLGENGKITVSKGIVRTITDNGFEINAKKTTYMGAETRQTVTGIVVNRKCNFTRKKYRYLRNLFYRWKHQGSKAAAFCYLDHLESPRHGRTFTTEDGNFSETLFRNHIRGVLSYYSMIVSKNNGASGPLQKLWTSYHDLTNEAVPEMIPERSVFRIETTYDYEIIGSGTDNFTSTGTAFAMNGIGIVTARHCLLPPSDKRVHLREDSLVEITSIDRNCLKKIEISSARSNGIDDWAVFPNLQISQNQPGLPLASSFDLQRGMTVIAYGFADGEKALRRIEAKVSEIIGNEIVVDRAFIQGMSGGPVLNARGKVIGMVTKGSGEGSYDRDGRFLLINSILDGYQAIHPERTNAAN